MRRRPVRPTSHGANLRRVVAGVAALAATSALAGCGVGIDDEPRALPITTTTTTTTPQVVGPETAVLWEVQAERLVPITRRLPDLGPQARVESLLSPPEAGEGRGMSSSIPASTELLGIREEGDLVTVDLSEEFDSVVGTAKSQAIGQIVMSLTWLSDVQQVSFTIDGEPLSVASLATNKDVDVVGACDFQTLLADPEADDIQLTETQLNLLDTRGAELSEACP